MPSMWSSCLPGNALSEFDGQESVVQGSAAEKTGLVGKVEISKS